MFPAKMSPVLARLALHQLRKLTKFNKHRRKIASYYFSNLPPSVLPFKNKDSVWLRFPIKHKNIKSIYIFAKRKGILLGDWYSQVVTPVNDLSLISYNEGSCSVAEKTVKNIINLPTYPNMTINDAKKVVETVKLWLNTQ
jgi:dTDP-4-amino-4,6-dideoxygalactose transaminase